MSMKSLAEMVVVHAASISFRTFFPVQLLRHSHTQLKRCRSSRSSCHCEQSYPGNLPHHVLRPLWQGQLHQGAILALLLLHTNPTTTENAGRLSLVSTSTDAQLLMTCFGVDIANVDIVERKLPIRSKSKNGSPIFSLGVASHLDLLITGHAERELRLWRLSNWTPVPGVALGGHTGWVRTLAVGNQIMISAACNFIKVWKLPGSSDSSHTIEHLGDLQLFKGDVLVTAMDDDCIYAATADGVLHMWVISSTLKNGSISSYSNPTSVQAHEGRIISLVLHNGVVITAGHDGHIRAWCKSTLQMKAEANAAHKGAKLHTLASASNVLFSGGADKFVRVWDPETLAPVGEPVQVHAAGVRSLAATTSSSPLEKEATIWLVSGDAQGNVALCCFVPR